MQHEVQFQSCSKRCQQCLGIAKHSERIAAAQMTLQQLLEEHQVFREEHNKDHDILLQRLPRELVGTIFRLCLPERNIWGVVDRQEEKKTLMPLLLGWVSRSWRRIAWSLAALWDTIHVGLSATGAATHESVLLDWLGRSAIRPISLSVALMPSTGWFVPYIEHDDDPNPFVKTLNDTSHRWRSLSIDLPHAWIRCFTGNGALPLDSLRLTSRDDDPVSECTSSIHQVVPGPSNALRIFLHGFSIRIIKPCWATLTHATISDTHIRGRDLVDFLQGAPLLLELKLVRVSEWHRPSQVSPFIHSKLKALTLEGIPTNLMSQFTLPALQDLSCDSFGFSFTQQLTALVNRSSCSLITLTIGRTSQNCPWPETVDDFCCLSALPSISSLALSVDLNEELCRMISTRQLTLAEGMPSTPFLPNLRNVQLEDTRSTQNVPWRSIPSLFSLNNDHTSGGLQALQSVDIRVALDSYSFGQLIDESTAGTLWDIKKSGGNITIKSTISRQQDLDLLEGYMKSCNQSK